LGQHSHISEQNGNIRVCSTDVLLFVKGVVFLYSENMNYQIIENYRDSLISEVKRDNQILNNYLEGDQLMVKRDGAWVDVTSFHIRDAKFNIAQNVKILKELYEDYPLLSNKA
jgi:hypothetical protein